jgi:hypothetical protein
MDRSKWRIMLGALLLTTSVVLYSVQTLIFHKTHETFFLLFQDLAFVPIHVLVLTLIVDQLLAVREKRAKLNKLNMVIGAFFSEAGMQLLKAFSGFDRNIDAVRRNLIITSDWTDQKLQSVIKDLSSYDYQVDYTQGDLPALKLFFSSKRDFLLRLLENPNLLEHETFTELLWAVFHLAEELAMREDLTQLSVEDGTHIAGDIQRAHVILIMEWLAYMGHLKKNYPYLFSLAVRTNPFDPNASINVK